MKQELKVFHAAKMIGYSNWIPNVTVAKRIDDADLILFEGGADVHPMIYNEEIGSHTYTSIERDVREVDMFNYAVKHQKPILGICRGAQLACVMAGGRLIQHQHNPSTMHSIFIPDEKEISITSLHHQAAFPYEMPEDNYEILGWTENMSPYHLDGEDKEITIKPFKEVEIAYYPKIRALGIQGHPEMMWHRNSHKDTFEYLHNLLDKLLK